MDTDFCWLVGYLEGEGTFYICHGMLRLEVSSVDFDVLARAATLLGGKIYKVNARSRVGKPQLFRTYIRGADAVRWAALLYPHLGERRQAQILARLAECWVDRGWPTDSSAA